MAQGGGSTSVTTRPRWALGLCDRCGFSYRLNQLKREFYDQRPNGLLVCPECLDRDNPQLWLGTVKVTDPQSLRDPRPDVGVQGSTALWGWMPVGNPLVGYATGEIGDVTVIVT